MGQSWASCQPGQGKDTQYLTKLPQHCHEVVLATREGHAQKYTGLDKLSPTPQPALNPDLPDSKGAWNQEKATVLALGRLTLVIKSLASGCVSEREKCGPLQWP